MLGAMRWQPPAGAVTEACVAQRVGSAIQPPSGGRCVQCVCVFVCVSVGGLHPYTHTRTLHPLLALPAPLSSPLLPVSPSLQSLQSGVLVEDPTGEDSQLIYVKVPGK